MDHHSTSRFRKDYLESREYPRSPAHKKVQYSQKQVEDVLNQFSMPELRWSRSILIQNLRSDKYILKTPIPICITRQQDDYFAICYDIDQRAEGNTEDNAISALCELTVAYFEELSAKSSTLPKKLQSHWRYLEEVFAARSSAKEPDEGARPNPNDQQVQLNATIEALYVAIRELSSKTTESKTNDQLIKQKIAQIHKLETEEAELVLKSFVQALPVPPEVIDQHLEKAALLLRKK